MKKLSTLLPIVTTVVAVAASWIAAWVMPALAWIGVPIAVGGGIYALVLHDRDRDQKRGSRDLAEGFTDGDSVEVDCRLCGQFNRVPAPRLRDRPICGRCKTRLMPGRRIVLCRSKRIEGTLRDELDELWSDEELLWVHLADHLAERRRTEEEKGRLEEDLRRASVN